MRSDDKKSYSFFKEFYRYYKELGQLNLQFEPHYKYSSCIGCSNFDQEVEGCVNKGRYCGSINYSYNITNASLVLQENIRQKCIWYNHKSFDPIKYWNYMVDFDRSCLSQGLFNEQCSENVDF